MSAVDRIHARYRALTELARTLPWPRSRRPDGLVATSDFAGRTKRRRFNRFASQVPGAWWQRGEWFIPATLLYAIDPRFEEGTRSWGSWKWHLHLCAPVIPIPILPPEPVPERLTADPGTIPKPAAACVCMHTPDEKRGCP
jgi:hypothetical protein